MTIPPADLRAQRSVMVAQPAREVRGPPRQFSRHRGAACGRTFLVCA